MRVIVNFVCYHLIVKRSVLAAPPDTDGQAALRELECYRPSIMFLDIGMPGMDGNEVTRRVRLSLAGQGVMLVALTGWGQDEDRHRSHEAGFD